MYNIYGSIYWFYIFLLHILTTVGSTLGYTYVVHGIASVCLCISYSYVLRVRPRVAQVQPGVNRVG